jgi:hypothetical protein
MPRFELDIDEAKFKELQRVLADIPNGARIAASTALNKTAVTGRKLLYRAISKQTSAATTSVAKRISIRKATHQRLEAVLILSGKRGLSLSAFHPKQTPTGVTVTMYGGEVDFPHAFIAKGLSGNRLVFERYGDKRKMQAGRYKGKIRQPIHPQYGPTVVDIYEKTPGLATTALKNIRETLDKNIQSQVDWLLKRGKPQENA